jgi:hypothetical protein
MEETNLI